MYISVYLSIHVYLCMYIYIHLYVYVYIEIWWLQLCSSTQHNQVPSYKRSLYTNEPYKNTSLVPQKWLSLNTKLALCIHKSQTQTGLFIQKSPTKINLFNHKNGALLPQKWRSFNTKMALF